MMWVDVPESTPWNDMNRIAHRMHEAAEAEMQRQGIKDDDREIGFDVREARTDLK